MKHIKYILLTGLFLVASIACSGRNFFVPKTQTTTGTQDAAPGDSIFFERGGTYFGQVKITRHGVYVGAYGTGPKPIITGGMPVGKFTAYKTNILRAPLVMEPKQLFSAGGMLTHARFPDTGYIMEKAKPGGYATAVYWAQAYFWTQEPATKYNPDGNTAYYLQGSIFGITVPGEWHWENGYLYIHKDTDTTGMRAAVVAQGIATDWNQENTTVENLHFEMQTEAAVWLRGYGAKGATVRNCNIAKQCLFGIWFMGIDHTFTGNTFSDILGAGITGYQVDRATINGNAFKRIGMVPGQGRTGWYNRGAVAITIDKPHEGGGGSTIANNIINHTGWAGIQTTVANTKIDGNQIFNTLEKLSDGAPIYVWGEGVAGTTITNNLIMGAFGNVAGSKFHNIAGGIYLDEYSQFVEVSNNVVSGTGTAGIIVNAGCHDNVVMQNRFTGHGVNIAEWSHKGATINNRVENNVFLPGADGYALRIESNFETECNLASYAGNAIEGGTDKPIIVGTVNNGLRYTIEGNPCESIRTGFGQQVSTYIQAEIILQYEFEGQTVQKVLQQVLIEKPQ